MSRLFPGPPCYNYSFGRPARDIRGTIVGYDYKETCPDTTGLEGALLFTELLDTPDTYTGQEMLWEGVVALICFLRAHFEPLCSAPPRLYTETKIRFQVVPFCHSGEPESSTQ
jgi:hypothetical protein